MKRYLYILLLPLLLLNCKKEKDPAPPPAIKELVGKWQLQTVERTINGETVLEEVPAKGGGTLTIRFDGVLLGSDGLPSCCGPRQYSIDGVPYIVKPQMEVPSNDLCARVLCAPYCPANIVVEKDKLTMITTCENFVSRSKYVRD
jgi:hypothetical protein